MMTSRQPQRLAAALALVLACSFGSAHPAQAQTASRIDVLNTDREFVQSALHDDAMEIADAHTAQSRASSTAVRDYAAMLLAGHSDANTQLSAMASQKNIAYVPNATAVIVETLPAGTPVAVAMDPNTTAVVVTRTNPYGVGGRMPPDRGWENETGPAFDRSYMRYEIAQHLIDIALYKDEIGAGHDADLTAHATAMLPKLYAELNAAQRFMSVPETPIN